MSASVEFYRRLLGLTVVVDLGWYAELAADAADAADAGVVGAVIAFVRAGHETVPNVAGSPPRGVLVSFEVDDIASHAAVATEMSCEFVIGPLEELGQRHFMVSDPDGTIVDVIERIPMTPADRRRLARYRHECRTGQDRC